MSTTYSSKSFSLSSVIGLHIAIPALLTNPSIFKFLKQFSSSVLAVSQLLRSIGTIFIPGLDALSSFKGSTEREIA